MSDESLRPAQGRSSDRRHGSGAPAWWPHLERTDLPDLERNAPQDAAEGWFSESVPPLIIEEGEADAPTHLRLPSWVVTTAVLLCALAVALLGIGLGSPRRMLLAAVVLGMPVIVSAVAVWAVRRHAGQVARRHRPPAA